MAIELMPLKDFVVKVTHQAGKNEQEEIKKAVREIHNKLFNRSIPRRVVLKIGRNLFVDLQEWDKWVGERKSVDDYRGPGRPRNR